MIKRFLGNAVALLMTCSMLIATPIVSMAAEVEANDDVIISASSTIPTYGTNDWQSPNEFTFTTSNTGVSRTVKDGRYLAYECNATSSTASYITISTYVDGTLRDTSNIPCNGTKTKVDWIDMQYSGAHTVKFVYKTQNSGQTATVKITFYSWD